MGSPFDAATKTLSFEGQALKLNSEVDAAPVREKIAAAEPLEVLCLQGCTVGPEAAKEIAKAMESKGDLKRMQFQDMFTGRLKQEIPQCLKYFCSGLELAGAHLVELNFSDNAIGPIGAEGLCPILRSEACYTLEELRLNNTGLGPTGSTMVAEALMDCFETTNTNGKPLGLKVFIAGRSRLENVGATKFAEVFAKMKTLEEIYVPQNGIFPEGIKALSQALLQNPNMKLLNLEDNTVKREGMQEICRALRKLEHVEELCLADGLLKTGGARVLAEALRETPSRLKKLTLNHNEIHLGGGLAVVSALEDHVATLESVNLDGNFFGDSGAEEIKTEMAKIGAEKCLVEFEEIGEPESDEEEEEEEVVAKAAESDEEEGEEPVGKEVNGHIRPPDAARQFLESPSLTRFRTLGKNPVPALQAAIESMFPDEEPLERDVELVARICDALTTSNSSSADAAAVVDVAKTLMSVIFRPDASAGDTQELGRRTDLLVNHMLVCMGLLKHEDKKWTMKWSPEGLLVAMKDLVLESYFPASLRSHLQFFLGRPNKLDCYMRAKTDLLRSLY